MFAGLNRNGLQKSYTAVVTPDPVGAGQTVKFTLTIVNTTKTQQLGSSNLTAPSQFRLIEDADSPSAPSPAGTADIVGTNGGTVQLRNLALPPSGTMTVTFDAEVPCANGDYGWSIITKQSNNFSGSPGNNYILTAQGSDLVTTVSGSCSLSWLTQPLHARTSTAITNTPYDAAFPPTTGPFIQVEVRSAPYDVGTTTRVLGSSDVVTLQIGANPGGLPATLQGTTSATAENGVATFSPGPQITQPGPNYTLLATNPIMVSGESTTFDISDAVCQTPCITRETSAGGTRASVDASNVPAGGFVAASVGVNVAGFTCTPSPSPNTQVVAVFPSVADPASPGTMVIRTTFSLGILDRPASQVRACLASALAFTQADGTPAVAAIIGGDSLFVGVPPDCDNQTPVAPCFLPSLRNNQTDELTIRLLVAGNDPYKR